MAAPQLNLDLSNIAIGKPRVPDPIATALSTVQTTMNALGNVHIADDADIEGSKLKDASIPSAKLVAATEKGRVARASTQLIGSASGTSMSWASADFERTAGDSWDLDTAPTKLYVRVAGKYVVSAFASFAANATGYRQFVMRLNGTTVLAMDTRSASSSDETSASLSTVVSLAKDDYIELRVFQTSGGNLNVQAGAHLEAALLP